MLVKIVTFFLIAMVVLAMFGRLRWPGGSRRIGGDRAKRLEKDTPPKPAKCPKCGSYIVGRGPCPCGGKG